MSTRARRKGDIVGMRQRRRRKENVLQRGGLACVMVNTPRSSGVRGKAEERMVGKVFCVYFWPSEVRARRNEA